LWYNVTHGFGQKWKDFFLDLEVHHDLNPLRPADVWLLHYLFLDSVNQDAQEWAAAWNSHRVQLKHSAPQSPREMFLFSMVQDGLCGVGLRVDQPLDLAVEDPESFGIDWEAADDGDLMDHLIQHNPQEWDDENPFVNGPATQSHVPCEPPKCPLTEEEITILDTGLASRVDLRSRNMQMRRLVWMEAFSICNHLVRTRDQ
ncbi:hypothetical protein C8J56DRAFT_787332, partial [Mycena floridula]